jgi:hypothetical protein
MSIQKKSLISTLKTAKKANVASAPLVNAADAKGTKGVKLGIAKKLLAKAAGGKRFAKLQGQAFATKR